jgi:hypothetical protein
MSAETDYLTSYFRNPNQVSLTVTTAQRPRSRPGPNARWEPGLASFGWCNLGGRRRDSAGAVTSLIFDSRVWFSDRVVNRGPTPTQWQQFAASDSDPVIFTFTLNGDHVHLRADLRRWGASWEADSTAYDQRTEQLIFVVPGAGAGAPPALMLTSFGPGAGFL